MGSVHAVFPDTKQVLVVFLHQELFPRVSLQHVRVRFQLIKFMLCHGDLLFVVLFAFLQFHQLPSFAEVTGNQIPGIEEEQPYHKTRARQHISVLQKRRYTR